MISSATDALPRKLKSIAFDLDGVLIDSETINVRSAFEVFEMYGHRLDDEDAHRIVGRHPVDYVPAFGDRFGMPEATRVELMRRQDTIYRALWESSVGPMPGAVEAVRYLSDRGWPLALATSSERVHAVQCLERLEIADAFGFIMALEDVQRRKPDPQIYLDCARRFGVSPDQLLVIEDSAVGVRAASDAGVFCVAVAPPGLPREPLALADVILDTLHQLPPRLILQPNLTDDPASDGRPR